MTGPVGRRLADKRFVLVEDRACFSIKQVDQYLTEKQDFVIRIKENVELPNRKSLQSLPKKDSSVIMRHDLPAGNPLMPFRETAPGYRMTNDNREIRVVTSLMND